MPLSLEEKAYDHIRLKLLRGQLRPGDPLRERTLAREIGISRTPVRHAIRQFEREGLVRHRHNAGAEVSVLSRRDMEELYELRIELEGLAAARAAARVTPPQQRHLRQLCRHFRGLVGLLERAGWKSWAEVGDDLPRLIVRDDLAFHLAILEIGDNQRVLRAMREIEVLAQLLDPCSPAAAPSATMLGVWRDHVRILNALVRHDARAARRLMRQHLLRARDDHLQRFDGEGPGQASGTER